MPAILDAAAPAPPSGGSGATAMPNRSRKMRIVPLALQACCLVLSVLAMALMANVLSIAQNIEVEDPGFVIHRASSALVVWAGTGGILNAAAASYLIYSGRPLTLNITGNQRIPIPPTSQTLQLALLAAAALVRTLVATCYAFADFNRAAALALAWDGDVDGASFPSFFTPETYAANQGWGDGTSPGVAARAKAARGCCAALTGLAGMHEMEGSGAGAHEVQGRQIHEMEGGGGGGGEGRHQQQRRVYEMDATESAVWREGVRDADADADVDEGKWERVP
ncbi:hypothetical protein UCDDS831_g01429 [Diplodia seriata]|uniref:CASP-like protein n=1 Tax=Diplodia seriata TaxID=420778 RepID=A0A0G2EVZ5_9PEZI|nr:hypothetical protein UCDDS831_g01429 [Diplodia seriata]